MHLRKFKKGYFVGNIILLIAISLFLIHTPDLKAELSIVDNPLPENFTKKRTKAELSIVDKSLPEDFTKKKNI